MLFVCAFDDATSLLVDGNDPEHARAIATEASGAAPSKLVPVAAGIFVAELFAEDDDGNELVLDPLEHVVDHLERIEATLDNLDAPVDELVCGDEADADEEIVTCRLAPGHEGQHEGVTSDGEAMLW